MGDLLHYESDNTTIVELLDQGIHFSHHLLTHFDIEQGQLYPVIAQSQDPIVHMVKWGIGNPIIAEGSRLSYIYGPSIENQGSLKTLYRHQRIVVPVKKFIHRRVENEPNVTIKHPDNKVLWMAGLWYENDFGEKGFAIITQNSIEEQRNKIRRIPVFISHKPLINQWLDKSNTSLPDLNKLMVVKPKPYVSQEAMSVAES